MATKKKAVKRGGSAKAWGIGGAITAATLAAAAGMYLLSDKKTKTKAKKWVAEARKEVVKNAKAARKLGEKEYAHIVDEVMKHHAALENLTAADVIREGKALKAEWKKIQAEAKKMAKDLCAKENGKEKACTQSKAREKRRGRKIGTEIVKHKNEKLRIAPEFLISLLFSLSPPREATSKHITLKTINF